MSNLKKLFAILIVSIILIILTVPVAFAAEAYPTEPPGNYLTWEFLGTMSGATAAVLLIVQFIKAPLDKIWKIPTRVVAYIFALFILICVELFTTGSLPAERLILTLLNAIVVTMAAMGTYEATFRKLESK